MIELAYRIVDVFSARPLAGNALCVVLDACPEPLMAAIAREVNLSETTFPTVTGPDAYDVRIFAPSAELPFAGHPTLGTAWVLGPGRWTQSSPGGSVTVDVEGDRARMREPVPEIEPWPADGAVAAARLPGAAGCWVAAAAGVRHLIVATDASIDALSVDLAGVLAAGQEARAQTFAVVKRVDDANLHVRVFAPGMGIAEDPGTGSAAGPIATVARDLWGTDRTVTIRQGDEIGRPSRIEVEVDPAGPLVGGQVAHCAEGRFTLPTG